MEKDEINLTFNNSSVTNVITKPTAPTNTYVHAVVPSPPPVAQPMHSPVVASSTSYQPPPSRATGPDEKASANTGTFVILFLCACTGIYALAAGLTSDSKITIWGDTELTTRSVGLILFTLAVVGAVTTTSLSRLRRP